MCGVLKLKNSDFAEAMKEIENSFRRNSSLMQKSLVPSTNSSTNKSNSILSNVSLSDDTIPSASSSPRISTDVLVSQAYMAKPSNRIEECLGPNWLSDDVIWQYYELFNNKLLQSSDIICMNPTVCHTVKSFIDVNFVLGPHWT